MEIKKLSKIISSRMLYLLIGVFLAIIISATYAAVTYPLPQVAPGQSLTAAGWNDIVDDINDLNNRIIPLESGSVCAWEGWKCHCKGELSGDTEVVVTIGIKCENGALADFGVLKIYTGGEASCDITAPGCDIYTYSGEGGKLFNPTTDLPPW